MKTAADGPIGEFDHAEATRAAGGGGGPWPPLDPCLEGVVTTDPGELAGEPTARIRRGELFWIAPDDARGPASDYAHPHLVIQEDLFNRSRITTVVVCALTSNLHRAKEPGNVLLDPGEGSLPRRSVVVASQISSVEKVRLGARIGSLSAARVEEVLAGLRFLQTSYFGQR